MATFISSESNFVVLEMWIQPHIRDDANSVSTTIREIPLITGEVPDPELDAQLELERERCVLAIQKLISTGV
jgi:hypothetical protein